MAFQRLNIRAMKSFSGLYPVDDPETSPSKSIGRHLESSPRSDLTQDTEECDLEDFGAKLERCKGKESPGKDSPSKRKRLLGSLRSLRSLANLHSSPNKARQSTTPRSESPSKRQDVCATPLSMSPSLALLHFERSPSDTPMFDLTVHHRSVSGSSLEVHHSSPVTVPGSARQPTPYNIFPAVTDLPAGTVPDTPGPMQKAFNRDPANRGDWHNANPTPGERRTPSTPVLSPLPGTNLSVGDVDPELVPLPPSANPSTAHLGRSVPGYFDLPVDEQPAMDSTDMLNGLACLKLADENCEDQGNLIGGVYEEARVGHHGTIEEIKHQYEDAKLRNPVKQLEIPRDRTRAHQRKQQAKDLQENVGALGVSKHRQFLPLRSKEPDEDLRGFRQDSCISEDWETCSGGQLTDMASERSLDHGRISPFHSAAVSTEECKDIDDGNNSPPSFGYVVWNSPKALRRGPAPESPWGRHTGLYDGTGYGPESSGPSTPREPDEGIPDMCSKASSAPFSVDGGRSGRCISNRHLSGAILNHEAVQEFSVTTNNQDDDDSLETIYRAYTNRIPSNNSNSDAGTTPLPAKRDSEVKS